MLYGNVAGSRTHVLRLLIGMFGLGVMAASVPGVTHTLLDGGHENRAVTAFTLAYVVTRVYGAQSWRRGEVLLDFPVAQHTVGVLPWVISLWTHPPVTVALWALGVALDLWLVLVVSGDDMLERAAARAEALTERESRGDARAPRRRPGRAPRWWPPRRRQGTRPGCRAPGDRGRARGHRPGSPGRAARAVRDHRARRGRGAGGRRGLRGGARDRAVPGRAGVVRAARRDVRAVGAVRLRRGAAPARRRRAGAARARAALRGHRGDRDGLGGARGGRRARQRAARRPGRAGCSAGRSPHTS